LVVADQAHWVNPTIWEVRDHKNPEWELIVNENTVSVVVNTIGLSYSTIIDWAAGFIATGEELDGVGF